MGGTTIMFNIFKKAEPTWQSYVVETNGSHRFCHDINKKTGDQVWYTESNSRELDYVMFITCHVPLYRDQWSMVKDTLFRSQHLAKQVFDHICS